MVSVIEANPRLVGLPSAFYPSFARNYAMTAAMAIRRLVDRRTDVRSLDRLLFDIQKHAKIITRDRFRALYALHMSDAADAAFDRLAGDDGAPSFPPEISPEGIWMRLPVWQAQSASL